MKFILFAFFIWRILLFLPLFIGYATIPYAQNAEYTNLWKFTKPYIPVDSFLLYPWANFDGVHYLAIAGEGYAPDGTNARFLPLYPITIAVVNGIFGSDQTYGAVAFFSALILSNVFFLASLYVFYKLIRIDYSENVARAAILVLLLFPTSFFFVSIYSESLFLLLTLLSFYFVRKKQWFASGVSGMLLSATRIVGISIFPALIYEYVIQAMPAGRQEKIVQSLRNKKLKAQTLLKGLPLLLAPLGIIAVAWYNQINWQNPFHFLKAHSEIGTNREFGIVLFPQTIFRYIKILLTVPIQNPTWWISFLEVFSFLFACMLLFIGYKKKIRTSYLIFAVIALFIPTSSGTFSGLPRYAIVLFPIFLTIALLNNRWMKIAYGVIGAVLSFILLAFFSRGYFIA